MADAFDSEASSSLLCDEREDLFFDDLDDVGGSNNGDTQNPTSTNVSRSEPLVQLLHLSDESFALMVEREKGYLPRHDYLSRLRRGELDMSVRREAFEWILKAHAYFGYGASSFCLSMNYVDRYLSVRDIPMDQTWSVQLLAVACFSIAVKVEEIDVPPSLELQVGEPRFRFEAKTIQRMELMILSTLNWKMCAVTPCSLIEYVVEKITDNNSVSSTIACRSTQLLCSMLRGIDFLEFIPSEIAVAAGIAILGKIQAEEIDKAISSFTHLSKGRVLKCIELIKDLWLISRDNNCGESGPGQPVPRSPNGVLDTMCFSYRSDGSTVGTGNPCADSYDSKRRRMDTIP